MLAIFSGSGIEHAPDFTAAGLQIMEKVQVQQPTWYFIYLVLLFGLFAWIRLYYGNILTQTVQASTNFQVANKMFKNNSLLQNQLDGALYMFYFLSMAFLLYYMELRIGLFPYEMQGGLLFLFNLALLADLFLWAEVMGRCVVLTAKQANFNGIMLQPVQSVSLRAYGRAGRLSVQETDIFMRLRLQQGGCCGGSGRLLWRGALWFMVLFHPPGR